MPIERSNQKHDTAGLDFHQLESIRIFSKEILLDQWTSLEYFAYPPGYQHFKGKKPDISVSSTATCVISLVATGKWKANGATGALLREITSKKKSAGLKNNNPFTIAWILEAVESLESLPIVMDGVTKSRTAKMDPILQRALKSGGVSIDSHTLRPAYPTQLVVRVLKRRKSQLNLKTALNEWAWPDARQLALVQAKSKTQDSFAVAYLLMLVVVATPSDKISPEQPASYGVRSGLFFAANSQTELGR